MNLDAFTRQRAGEWDELATLVARAGRRPQRLGPEGVRRLGATYRAAAADLALARRRWPGDPVTVRLENLVGRSRHLVYASERRMGSLRAFLSTGYWRLVRERLPLIGLCWLMMLVPALFLGLWAASDPAGAARFLPGTYREAGEGGTGPLALPLGVQAALAGQILTNNIQVSFLAFAGGILGGVGTALVLLYNGALIGGVAGLTAAAGRLGSFVELVAPHGVLELSVIAVSGAAGMTVGWALVDPGRRSRRTALVAGARRGAEIVLGTMPWFVLAGLVEGFVTPRRVGTGTAIAVGVSAGALYWILVLWRGRAVPAAPGASAAPAAPGASAAPVAADPDAFLLRDGRSPTRTQQKLSGRP